MVDHFASVTFVARLRIFIPRIHVVGALQRSVYQIWLRLSGMMAAKHSTGPEVVGRCYPHAHKAMALAFLFVSCLAIFTNIVYLRQLDFIAYWAAAVMALQGNPAGAYDVAAHMAVQNSVAVFHNRMPFAYPPPFLLLLIPFGFLPYAFAAALWILTTATAYFAAVRKLLPGSVWLAGAFPPVLVNGMIGQAGLLLAAIFIAGIVNLKRRPFIAGLFLGCLVIKPQLAVLLPLAFIAGGQWRAFAGAAVSSCGLVLLGALFFGADSYLAMLHQMPLFVAIATDGLSGWYKMSSVYAALRFAGAGSGLAWLCHIAVGVGASAILWWVWRQPVEMAAKAAVLVTASVLISPYLYAYDTVILVVPFFWLAARGENRLLLAILWCIPLLSIGQALDIEQSLNLAPAVPIMLLALIFRQLFHAKTRKLLIGSQSTPPLAAWYQAIARNFSRRASRSAPAD